jgi:hypothetical protein
MEFRQRDHQKKIAQQSEHVFLSDHMVPMVRLVYTLSRDGLNPIHIACRENHVLQHSTAGEMGWVLSKHT